jgi:hypothetical protein
MRVTSWEYATLEISAVQLATGSLDPAASSHDTAEWQAYAIGPEDELLFEEYRPYRVPWARLFAEHLNRLGRDGWELVAFGGPQHALYPTGYAHSSGTHPTVVESRFVLRRAA